MTVTSAVSRAMASWRNALVEASRASHAVARLQSEEMRARFPEGVYREVLTPGGRVPMQWPGGAPDTGTVLDRYDTD